MNERRQDFELLQRFTRGGDQAAFTEVVRRHLDLVFATALRKVEDAGAAGCRAIRGMKTKHMRQCSR